MALNFGTRSNANFPTNLQQIIDAPVEEVTGPRVAKTKAIATMTIPVNAAKAAKAARPARKSRYLRLSLAICYGLARAVSLAAWLRNAKKCWQAIMHRRFATRSHAAMSSIEKIIASDSPTKKIDLVVVPVRRLPMMFPLLRGQSRRPPQPEVGILGLLRVLSHKTEGHLLGLGPPFRCRARPARP